MITKRKSNERGSVSIDWLKSQHTFSFGSYYDPMWMGFSSLRVINEDWIDEGKGFDTHPHKDMEIITFILEGVIEHKDTLGNHSKIYPGEIQIMSAGTGVYHSEFNPNTEQKTHLLQIWIEPDTLGVKPRYEQFTYAQKQNELVPLASAEGGENIAKIYQDASIFYGDFQNDKMSKELDKQRKYWIQVIAGQATVNDEIIESGDALGISDMESLQLSTTGQVKFLLFDLP